MTRQIVIAGAGPAGIEAARSAAAAGASVTLVGDAPMGGRAGWHSLAPSKVWLHAADTLGILQHAEEIGITLATPPRVEPARVLARMQSVMRTWNEEQRNQLAALGVTMRTGLMTLQSPNAAVIEDDDGVDTVEAHAIILAGGSVPHFPPAMRPDGKRILAPRFAGKLDTLPKSTVVVGGGATGTEFAYLFNRLGVAVTWVVNHAGVLPGFAPAAGRFMAERMRDRGVTLLHGRAAVEATSHADGVTVVLDDGTHLEAEQAFLAVGRRADLSRLNLEAVGLTPNAAGALTTDRVGRTAVPSIYAVGDIATGPMLANRATAQARIAGRHAAGCTPEGYRPETVVHAIYADPQVAQVGAMQGNVGELAIVELPYTAGLKAHLAPHGPGFLQLAYAPVTGQVTGGLAVGDHAADLLAPVAMAIQMHATIDDLAAPGGAYPTVSELVFLAAQEAVRRQEKTVAAH